MNVKHKGNPQVENGYTRIANELLEELAKVHLTPNEWKVLCVVIRKTWGFGKKEDRISLSQFVGATKLHRKNVCRAITGLISKQMIAKNKGKYHVWKRYFEWKSYPQGYQEVMRVFNAR